MLTRNSIRDDKKVKSDGDDDDGDPDFERNSKEGEEVQCECQMLLGKIKEKVGGNLKTNGQ